MAVIISMLRGVNVGGHNIIKMEVLRGVYQSLGLQDPQTYVQSGNVLFRTGERSLSRLSEHIQTAIERKAGFRPEVILRTAPELRAILARSPFARRPGLDPGKLVVTFLANIPAAAARKTLLEMKIAPEELHVTGRELYIYFPNRQGRAKISWAQVEKAIGPAFTSRNWNTVTKLLELADSLEQRS